MSLSFIKNQILIKHTEVLIENIIHHIIEKSKLFDVYLEEDNYEYRKQWIK